jgi:hypothetical protein
VFGTLHSANIGDVISVPVSIGTTGVIRAWGLDVEFPSSLLRYDSAMRGSLTTDFGIFGANQLAGEIVRIGAFAGEISSGQVGELAIVQFTVIGEGCGSFCIAGLFDEIASYQRCTNVPPTSMAVSFDVKPSHCPNRLNPFGSSTFQAAIVGTTGLDVETITSIELSEEGGTVSVTPTSTTPRVLADPIQSGCNCSSSPPDGITDLVLTFDQHEVLDALGPNPGPTNVRVLKISGTTESGQTFHGTDCVNVVQRRSETAFDDDGRFDPREQVYILPAPDDVRLTIYDVRGRLIATLVDSARPAGSHHVDLGSKLVDGVYFVRFKTSERTTNHKVVVR